MKINKYVEEIKKDKSAPLALALKTCPMYYEDGGEHKLDEDDFRDHCASLAAERLFFYWTGMGDDGTSADQIANDLAGMAAKFAVWARDYRKNMEAVRE